MGEEIGCAHDQGEDANRQEWRIPSDRGLAQAVINQPASAQRSNGNKDRFARGHLEHRRVDQIGGRIDVILDHQKRKARDPGEIGFPFVPDQVVRQFLGRNEKLLDVIEAAAVHFPCGSGNAFFHLRPLAQGKVERNEVEGRANPTDTDDQVGPSKKQVQPVHCKGKGHNGTSIVSLKLTTSGATAPDVQVSGRGNGRLLLIAAACRRRP